MLTKLQFLIKNYRLKRWVDYPFRKHSCGFLAMTQADTHNLLLLLDTDGRICHTRNKIINGTGSQIG